MDYNKFFTETAKRRQPSDLRELAKIYVKLKGNENFIPLGGGLPSAEVFHFTEATLKMKDGSELKLDNAIMEVGQQYGTSEGYLPLVELLRDFQARLHNPPMKQWDLIVTNGCQDGTCKTFEMLLNEGDFVIGGSHCYSGALEPLRAIGVKFLPVEQDSLGMIPASLYKVLSQFDWKNDKVVPKLIYIVPNGGNPEASTVSVQRRKEIYKLAHQFDLLILEDDPYQFILFDQEELPTSFLSLDVDGRVIRADSFSKIVAPGFRLGCVTAAPQIITRILYHIQVTTQQPCCLSQVVLYSLLKKWGYEGYIKNAKAACKIYNDKKDVALRYAKLWLEGLAEWDRPSGGMFMWIKIKNIKSSAEICRKALFRNVMLSPGHFFKYDKSDSPYIRVSFSNATEAEFENGFRILAEIIREETGTYIK